jgi:hypothetical protein
LQENGSCLVTCSRLPDTTWYINGLFLQVFNMHTYLTSSKIELFVANAEKILYRFLAKTAILSFFGVFLCNLILVMFAIVDNYDRCYINSFFYMLPY